MLYLTLGLVHYHQKKHHLYELDHTPVEKTPNDKLSEYDHHMLSTDVEAMIGADH